MLWYVFGVAPRSAARGLARHARGLVRLRTCGRWGSSTTTPRSTFRRRTRTATTPLRSRRDRLERSARRLSTRPIRSLASGSGSSRTTRRGSISTATPWAACRSRRPDASRRCFERGRASSWAAGIAGSTRRSTPVTCWPRPCSAPGPARCSRATRRPSTSTSSRARRSRLVRAGASSSPTATTSRPIATCSRDSRRPASADLRMLDCDPLAGPQAVRDRGCMRVRRCRARHALARGLPLGGARRPARDHARRARRRCARPVGSEPLGGRGSGRSRGLRGRSRGWLHLQVPERRARAPRPTSTCAASCRSRCARRSRAGSGSATSSRWSGRTSRTRVCAGSLREPRRSSAWRRSTSEPSSSERPASRRSVRRAGR